MERYRYNFSTLIDIVVFLATHQLASRGKIDTFESEDEGGNGFFLVCVITVWKKTSV